MQTFSSHDTGSNGEDLLRANKGSSTEIGAGANGLQDGADGDEAGDIGDWEVVLARLNWLNASRLDGRNQEVNMGRLVDGNEFEVDKEFFVKACIEEILLLEASESFLVEGILKMFQLF